MFQNVNSRIQEMRINSAYIHSLLIITVLNTHGFIFVTCDISCKMSHIICLLTGTECDPKHLGETSGEMHMAIHSYKSSCHKNDPNSSFEIKLYIYMFFKIVEANC